MSKWSVAVKIARHVLIGLLCALFFISPLRANSSFMLNIYDERGGGCIFSNEYQEALEKGWLYTGYLFHIMLRQPPSTVSVCDAPTGQDGLLGIANKDQSYCILQNIFGRMPRLFNATNGPSCAANSTTTTSTDASGDTVSTLQTASTMKDSAVLAEIIRVFNYGLFAVLYVFIGIGLINAVLVGGYEGSFVERHFSMISAVRICFSSILLLPTSQGYSMAQMAAMYVILNGIGFADRAFSAALREFIKGNQYGTLQGVMRVEQTPNASTSGESLLDEDKMNNLTDQFSTMPNGYNAAQIIGSFNCSIFQKMRDILNDYACGDQSDNCNPNPNYDLSPAVLRVELDTMVRTQPLYESSNGKYTIGEPVCAMFSFPDNKSGTESIYLDYLQQISIDAFVQAYSFYYYANQDLDYATAVNSDNTDTNTVVVSSSMGRYTSCVKAKEIYGQLTSVDNDWAPQFSELNDNARVIPVANCINPPDTTAATANAGTLKNRPDWMEVEGAATRDHHIFSGINWGGNGLTTLPSSINGVAYSENTVRYVTDISDQCSQGTCLADLDSNDTKTKKEQNKPPGIFRVNFSEKNYEENYLLPENENGSGTNFTSNMAALIQAFEAVQSAFSVQNPPGNLVKAMLAFNDYDTTSSYSPDNLATSLENTSVQGNATQADASTFYLLYPFMADSVTGRPFMGDEKGYLMSATTLNISGLNLQTSLLMVFSELIGFEYFEGKMNEKKYKQHPLAGSCKSKFMTHCNDGKKPKQGCFNKMVELGCIREGRGLLGATAALQNSVIYNPFVDFVTLGQTIMSSSFMYLLYNNEQLFQLYAELSVVNLVIKTPARILSAVINDVLNDKGPKWWKLNRVHSSLAGKLVEVGNWVLDQMMMLDEALIEMYTLIGSAFALLLFPLGFLLAILIPFYPAIIFIISALGYFVAVAEAMVFTPIAVIGLAHPQSHDIVGKSAQGFMALFGVFMRPILLVFSVFIAINVMNLSIGLLNVGFISQLDKLAYSIFNVSDLLGSKEILLSLILGVVFVYVFAIWEVVSKSCSLIAAISGGVMAYLSPSLRDDSMQKAMGALQGIKGDVSGMGSSLRSGFGATADSSANIAKELKHIADRGLQNLISAVNQTRHDEGGTNIWNKLGEAAGEVTEALSKVSGKAKMGAYVGDKYGPDVANMSYNEFKKMMVDSQGARANFQAKAEKVASERAGLKSDVDTLKSIFTGVCGEEVKEGNELSDLRKMQRFVDEGKFEKAAKAQENEATKENKWSDDEIKNVEAAIKRLADKFLLRHKVLDNSLSALMEDVYNGLLKPDDAPINPDEPLIPAYAVALKYAGFTDEELLLLAKAKACRSQNPELAKAIKTQEELLAATAQKEFKESKADRDTFATNVADLKEMYEQRDKELKLAENEEVMQFMLNAAKTRVPTVASEVSFARKEREIYASIPKIHRFIPDFKILLFKPRKGGLASEDDLNKLRAFGNAPSRIEKAIAWMSSKLEKEEEEADIFDDGTGSFVAATPPPPAVTMPTESKLRAAYRSAREEAHGNAGLAQRAVTFLAFQLMGKYQMGEHAGQFSRRHAAIYQRNMRELYPDSLAKLPELIYGKKTSELTADERQTLIKSSGADCATAVSMGMSVKQIYEEKLFGNDIKDYIGLQGPSIAEVEKATGQKLGGAARSEVVRKLFNEELKFRKEHNLPASMPYRHMDRAGCTAEEIRYMRKENIWLQHKNRDTRFRIASDYWNPQPDFPDSLTDKE